jgi:acyl transferase domain-containing protein
MVIESTERKLTAPHLLAMAAADPHALRDVAIGRLNELTDQTARVVAPLPGGRWRHAIVGRDREQVADGLREFLSGAATGSPATRRPRVVFAFSGHGGQQAGLGAELLMAVPRFAESMTECSRAIQAETGWSLIDLLLDGNPMTDVGVAQPAVWALQVSLARLWRDWGIEPDVVLGHSMGEIAAAVTAGSLTVRAAAQLVCLRGALLENLRGVGDMWAVGLGEDEARQAIGAYADRVWVCAVNTDRFTTLSGDADALAAITVPLVRRRVFCRKLAAGVGGHSPQVDPILPDLRAGLSGLEPSSGRIPLYSTMLDRYVDGGELTAAYWTAHTRRPVRFASACRSVVADEREHTLFVEIGPRSALVGSIEENLITAGRDGSVVPSLRRDRPELESMTTSLASAFVAGCDPAWSKLS